MSEFKNVLDKDLSFGIYTKALPLKGNMAWEYNPLRNYRLTENKYKYDNLNPKNCTNGTFYSLVQLEDIFGITIGGTKEEIEEAGFKGTLRERVNIEETSINYFYKCTIEEDAFKNKTIVVGDILSSDDYNIEVYEPGLLVDFQTEELDFDLNHPVNITPQYSYDNSVNLIINDGKNIPRLINSRFSAIGKNQYEIIDRKGDNDTNIYDQGDQFDIDTSLYKRTIKIPTLEFKGVYPGGNMKVGNYHFYFKYADADDNETDWVAESGLVSLFIGSTPDSIISGFANENSRKLVKFRLKDVDSAYDYIKVYYTKESSDTFLESERTCFKISLKFIIDSNNNCDITISGFVDDEQISEDEINVQYQMVSSAESQTICKNMLFLANIHKPDIPYKELADLSLRFLPKRNLITYDVDLDSQYSITSTQQGYYDPKFIYNFTGYWNNEIYRLGVVYIMPDNSLSPVFNIRGGYNLDENPNYTKIDLFENGTERKYISIDEKTNLIIKEKSGAKYDKSVKLENAKGVITLATTIKDNNNRFQIYGIQIEAQDGLISQISKYTKGFFFVRQKRMPTTLCQAIMIAQDRNTNTPVIPIGKKDSLFTSQLDGVAFTLPRKKITSRAALLFKKTEYENDTPKNKASNLLENTKYFAAESFLNSENRYITNSFLSRIRPLSKSKVNINTAICPEFEVDLPYFRSIFTGDDFKLEPSDMLPVQDYLFWDISEERNFYVPKYEVRDRSTTYDAKILGVPDSSKAMAIGKNTFKGQCGNPLEAFRYDYIGYDNKVKYATNFLRGNFGPYLGVVGGSGEVLKTYDIKIPGYSSSNMEDYFDIRYNDNSEYFAISDRFTSDTFNNNLVLYRGDCYICQFTHRINRNFQDPSAPNNSIIVDSKCWANNYTVSDGVVDKSKFRSINLGDVNAVKLGMWVTFTVRSTKNLCLRGIDESHSEEKALIGHGRGFYPYYRQSLDGSYKTPESDTFNKGFLKEASIKHYYEVADVPYIKNEFTNRILFSRPNVNDSFVNNLRVFESKNFKDYSKEYGQITKIVEVNGSLLIIFEHGIGYTGINEKTLLTDAENEDRVFVGSGGVLSEPTIISDKFGSQWKESIIKTPYYVYGVDTVAKKIWRVTVGSTNVETISDTRIGSFLNENISLGERELEPVIGIRNVKSHYNAFKQDVMFTFYDNLYGFEEKVWNICWNELTQVWTTMYSWVPSYSENIFNQYFSFDRNTSKWIAELGTSKSGNDFSDGIVLNNNIIDDSEGSEYDLACKDLNSDGTFKTPIVIGIFSIVNRNIPSEYTASYHLYRDNFLNWDYFRDPKQDLVIWEWEENTNNIKSENGIDIKKETLSTNTEGDYELILYKPIKDTASDILLLNVSCEISNSSKNNKNQTILDSLGYYKNVIAVALKSKIYGGNKLSVWTDGELTTKDNIKDLSEEEQSKYILDGEYYYISESGLTTDFWKHGQAGLLDIADKILPTHWYGKQHPFEFEFCVNEYPEVQKIFDNLKIISNNAEPESFHYQIIGDSLDFANDKANMYIRQETVKELYQYNGSNILYDSDWSNIEKERIKNFKYKQNPRSTILPHIYESRQDTFNEIEDYYKSISCLNKNYDELSGSEIVHDKITDEYGIWTHSKAINIDDDGGRLRGNMTYFNDVWQVQIDPINYVQKNEDKWEKIPVSVANVPIPTDVNPETIDIPEDLQDRKIDTDSWGCLPMIQNVEYYPDEDNPIAYTYSYGGMGDTVSREQTKIRDKYIKIRIRYSGEKLAIINKIITSYSQSL